ncbi:hypothetical protein [Rhodopseudomonas palustris]|uniref:hypothetical protein n=1 Tax=Rhodopseudomonas palustris TaxID=1076 RepID=UPI000B112E93|nr:hypothetical protein [Rhodopseudomonas palustris]
MVDTSDPLSDERKRSEFWRRVRRMRRNFVNRQTFLLGLRVIALVVRVVELVSRLRSGL